MRLIVATNIVASQQPKRQPTETPTVYGEIIFLKDMFIHECTKGLNRHAHIYVLFMHFHTQIFKKTIC